MRKSLYLAAGLSVAVAALTATVPADATGAGGGRHARATPAGLIAFKIVANNLNNPRQLNFAKSGKLYIAEAGTGGTDDCTIGGELSTVCWGATGSVTVVANGHQKRVIDGLPSYADQGAGTAALGPADVVPYGHGKLAISLGYGLKPKQRDALAKPGNRFATIISADLKNKKLSKIADLAAFEQKHNPVADRNTDPTGLLKWGKTWYAADSGANDVLKVAKGKTKLVAAFQNQKTSQGKVQAVPTDVAVGPDGALYVAELTGFPFVKGAAKIFRIVPGHKPTVYANHLTNVTSIAFGKDGKLYAVQIANDGLQSGPTGSLWRVASKKSGKKSKNLTGDLFAPYGVAIKGKNAYVSTGAVAPGSGQVIKVPLP
jgi:glucose/arabinose dehydrogenase